MEKQTPKTKTTNESQRSLKSIDPMESIAVNVTKKVNGDELEKVLNGVAAFTKAFNQNDQYELTVKVDKLIEDQKEAVNVEQNKSAPDA